jgi:hypothetical protein
MNLTITPRPSTQALLTVGSTHEIRIFATKYFEANSLTMKFLIPKGVQVDYVEMSDGTKVESRIANDGYFNLSWYFAVKPSQPDIVRSVFNAGELFMTITVTILDTYDTGETLEVILTNSQDNEITGSYEPHVIGTPVSLMDLFVVLPELVLESDSYVMPKMTQTDQKVAQGYVGKPTLPVCKNCKGRVGTRCSFGGFVTAAGGTCKSYQP